MPQRTHIASPPRTAATPGYYVIDHACVIRYKWVGNPGAKAIDAALEKLIQVVEGKRPAKRICPCVVNH